jgi:hypothetical protein
MGVASEHHYDTASGQLHLLGVSVFKLQKSSHELHIFDHSLP